jgi:uncharacterized 2Fe-2S/4Fe-4S cluster protein (DUF4445 family)
MKFKVRFQPEGREVRVERGKTILEAAREGNIGIRSICGGKGVCGKCRVMIGDSEKVNEVTETEKNLLSRKELEEGYRLACLTKIFGDNKVAITEESRLEKQKILIGGIKRKIRLEPRTQKIFIKLPRPSIEDPRSDLRRIEETLKEKIGLRDVSLPTRDMKELPGKIREKNFLITCYLRDSKLIRVEPSVAREDIYGIAIDIGTTTIVAYLLDLRKGDLVGCKAISNPQIPYSEDIIGRLSYANENGICRLNKVLVEGINGLVKNICKESRVDSRNVYEGVIVGNTAMHHLLLGLNTKHLSVSPYLPVLNNPLDLNALELGINAIPHAQIFIPPVIGGFVGPDHAAAILASRIYKMREPFLVIDVGTNTEISLGKNGEIFCCSAAAGPAFEGGRIRHGMRACEGAIEEVKINPETCEAKCRTINNKKPRGICGSGLIDLVAELLRAGALTKEGKMQVRFPCIKKEEGGPEFVVSQENKEKIVVTQRDIRQIQLAKSAIHTGIEVLMEESDASIEEIKKVLLAGAFGNYIKPSSAREVGLIPPIPLENVRNIGNAAGSGAQMMLLSKNERKNVESFIKKIKKIELAARPDFQRRFIRNTRFGWN